jgi:hypothetical protein
VRVTIWHARKQASSLSPKAMLRGSNRGTSARAITGGTQGTIGAAVIDDTFTSGRLKPAVPERVNQVPARYWHGQPFHHRAGTYGGLPR